MPVSSYQLCLFDACAMSGKDIIVIAYVTMMDGCRYYGQAAISIHYHLNLVGLNKPLNILIDKVQNTVLISLSAVGYIIIQKYIGITNIN